MKNYSGVINIEMPTAWLNEMNNVYKQFTETPSITQIDPNYWPDYISTKKSDIFFLGDPLFEIISTSPDSANFATLCFSVGVDDNLQNASYPEMSLSSTYASMRLGDTVKFECCNIENAPGNLYAEWKASWA